RSRHPSRGSERLSRWRSPTRDYLAVRPHRLGSWPPIAPDHPRLRGRDIVCVGFADWDTELWTNQHHLMSRLARENRVLFVESLGLRRPQLAGRDLSRMARRLRRGLAPARA